MLQELTNKIKKTLKDKEWTRLSLLEHGLKEYPEGYEHYEDIDITLEDVLVALDKTQQKTNEYLRRDVKITLHHQIIINGKIVWQLGKPLHEQSEETIKELNKLI